MAHGRRKVVHVTSVHRPDDPRIFYKECRSLAAAGYEVVLVAPDGPTPAGSGVRHVPLRPANRRSERIWKTAAMALRAAWRERADLYHVHDPELIPGALLLKAAGRRVLYDAHEDLPQQIRSKSWLHPAVRRPVSAAARLLEAVAARSLDGIVAATPTIGRRFPGAVIVENYPQLAEESRPHPPARHANEPTSVVYVGGIEVSRGAIEMVDAMSLLDPNVKLLMAGPIRPPALRSRLEESPGWRQVEALGWVAPTSVGSLLATSRAGLCVLHPLPNYLDSLPTKLFEYMAAGLPVVASDFPAWRRIVAANGAGLMVDPRDPSAIAQAIAQVLADPIAAEEMGRRAREAVRREYRWERAADRLVTLYRGLVPLS